MLNEYLRKQAEKIFSEDPKIALIAWPDGRKDLIHELNVCQIELKILNDKLNSTQIELEKSWDRYADIYNFAPIRLLYKNIKELTSSFGRHISKKTFKLTPREIEICDLVKNGLTSKDIAYLQNISVLTIEKHRRNIRKKLGLNNKKYNLSSYLKQMK